MRKDFADRVTSQAVNRRARRRRPFRLPTFSFSLPKLPSIRWPSFGMPSFRLPDISIPSGKLVRGLMFAGIGLLAVWTLAGSGGADIEARASIPQEEWIGSEAVAEAPVAATWKRHLIKSGDAAAPVLLRMGYPRSEVNAILKAAKPVYSLRNIRAGHYFISRMGKHGPELSYNLNDQQVLYLSKQGDTWKAEKRSRIAFTRQSVYEGTINDNLFLDAARVGMDDRTTMNLVDIFSWDIDFVRDMRTGDSFRVLAEERFDAEGRAIGSVIMAAEFVNQGHSFKAVRFTLANGSTGYYTPEGKSMRKTYLKAPVKFSRISSRFQLKRKHPVLGFTRAHRGVDYAASSGTPIHAVGDGRIRYAGWKGGYGRFILIRHLNSRHETAYGHMRAYARGMRKGKRVRQGDVIGYVGMSGLATGPHLHFEFRVGGRAVNPLTIKRSPAKPVPKGQMARFRGEVDKSMQAMTTATVRLAWG